MRLNDDNSYPCGGEMTTTTTRRTTTIRIDCIFILKDLKQKSPADLMSDRALNILKVHIIQQQPAGRFD